MKFQDLTTLATGGNILHYCEVKTMDELVNAVTFAKQKELPIFTIGEGSDILAGDGEFKGIVIKLLCTSIEFRRGKKFSFVKACAGMKWDDLVDKCVKRSLQGVECLSGIPGTVGASPIQNIGAYGQDVSSTIDSLTVFDIAKMDFVNMSNEDCEFGYRESFFKKSTNWQKYIIWSVTFKLKNNAKPEVQYESLKKYLDDIRVSKPTLKDVRRAVLKIRSEKFENYKIVPNAGSFFKNPTINSRLYKRLTSKYKDMPCFENPDGSYKCFAGWFIEQAGWKGKKFKNAVVSPKHALILLNPQKKASAAEILALADQIVKDVKTKFGVLLELEVQRVNL